MRGTRPSRVRWIRNRISLSVVLGLVGIIGVGLLIYPTAATSTNLNLQPGPFAPNAQGEVEFALQDGALSGHAEAQNLPALGPHAFYVFWFVRTDTGNKAFLGPLIHQDSILFLSAGDGKMNFAASAFTNGLGAGSAISLGPPGTNFFVLIAENQIDTFMPFPISPPPSSFALTVTF